MEVRFHIDLDTGLPHFAAHGVEPGEVLQALRNREADVAGRRQTRLAEGQTNEGRYLRVIYSRSELDDTILVITAYELDGNAKRAFRRRRRKRK